MKEPNVATVCYKNAKKAEENDKILRKIGLLRQIWPNWLGLTIVKACTKNIQYLLAFIFISCKYVL